MTHLSTAQTGTEPLSLPQGASVPNAMSSGSLAAWQVKCMRLHIGMNLEATLQASELAAVARLSVSYFSRAFRVSFGQPPHAYVMSRRIEKAKRLILSNEPMSLAQVALSCGLSDQAHLSRMFRNLVGESPSGWRRRNWSPIAIYRPSEAATATVSSH
jgi:AraC family transcriptional regulator